MSRNSWSSLCQHDGCTEQATKEGKADGVGAGNEGYYCNKHYMQKYRKHKRRNVVVEPLDMEEDLTTTGEVPPPNPDATAADVWRDMTERAESLDVGSATETAPADTTEQTPADVTEQTPEQTPPTPPTPPANDATIGAVDTILSGAGYDTYTDVVTQRDAANAAAAENNGATFRNPRIDTPADDAIVERLKQISDDNPPHEVFYSLFKWLSLGENIALIGPAGSGKTSAVRAAADLLGLDYYSVGACQTPYELTGFISASGDRVETSFSRFCQHGGVFLFDELDGSSPKALTVLHEALDNRRLTLPGGESIELHPSCLIVASANTWGRGADRTYVGRNALDGATLDRFVQLAMNYDEVFESAILGVEPDAETVNERERRIKKVMRRRSNSSDDTRRADRAEFIGNMRRIRRAVEELNINHVVGMRAGRRIVKLIEGGYRVTSDDIKLICGAGIDDGTWRRISKHIVTGSDEVQ